MPSLPHLVSNGPTARQRERWRGKTQDRGYGADWRKLRALKLATDPFCQLRITCQGAVATEVDHDSAISERPELRLVWSNLRSSCKPCNVAKRNQTPAKADDSSAKSGVFVDAYKGAGCNAGV